jgi:hypothetical protein
MGVAESLPPPTLGVGLPIVPMVCADVARLFSGPVVALVQADLCARAAIGEKKYGLPLRADNGRRGLVEAYQEQLDACNYLRQAIEQHDSVEWLYDCALVMACQMRQLLSSNQEG